MTVTTPDSRYRRPASAASVLSAILLSAAAYLGCAPRDAAAITSIVTISDRPATRVSELFTLDKAIQLRIPSDLTIGPVRAVETDPSNGDVFLLDRDATRAVYRFSSDGSFLRTYPAEPVRGGRPELLDVAVVPGDGLIMAGNLLLRKYGSGGVLECATVVPSTTHDIFVSGHAVYMLTSGSIAAGRLSRARQVVSYSTEHLKEARRFGFFEERLRQWNFYPSQRYFAALGEHVFSPMFYEPIVIEYASTGREVRRFRFPARSDDATPDLWSSAELTAAEKRAILRRLHVLNALVAVGQRLFLVEIHRPSGLVAPLLFAPETASTLRFPNLRLLQNNGEFAPGECSFQSILGGDGRSLIVLLDDARLLATCKTEFAQLDSLDPAVLESPLLLFLRPRA